MKYEKNRALSIDELAKEWGIDVQTVRIKAQLIETIRLHCKKNKISQRKLALMVPGLSQDRIWRIFAGQVGHMTIDKLVEILSTIGYKVKLQTLAA